MKPSPEVDPRKILNLLYQRKGIIIAVFVVGFSLAGYLAVSLPDVYQSSTLILITPQKLPSTYIHSTVTLSVEQRIRAIIEQILSRTRLENIVKDFNLYPGGWPRITMEDRIERLRKTIRTEIRRDDSLQLSFESESPDKAMQVTTRLASLFIDANLQVREQQAMGTTAFMSAEADRLRKELEEQEAKVNLYKAQHRYELPEQLDANLRTLQQLRLELQSNILRLSGLQERKASLEQQSVETDAMLIDLPRAPETEGGQIAPRWQSVQSRKTQLDALLTQYSEKHPDVIRLKKEIQDLEAQAPAVASATKNAPAAVLDPPKNAIQQMLVAQIADLNTEIKSLRATNEGLRSQIASYQVRADNTPIRSIELAKITRTYDITLKKYQDLLAKSLDSQLSENMEKNQKGEQFQVIDPANFPLKPARPNRLRILLVGFLAALAGGVGLVIFLGNLDTSFKTEDEVTSYVDVPLLAAIPTVTTRGSVLERIRIQGILFVASLATIAVGISAIRFYGPVLAGFF